MKVAPTLSDDFTQQNNALAAMTSDIVQNLGAILWASEFAAPIYTDPHLLSEFNVKLEAFLTDQLGAATGGDHDKETRISGARRKAAPMEN